MAETLSIVSERVDDSPVLLAQLDRMGLQPLLDEHFPTHGNWVGLSMGWVSVLWLTPIRSAGDHRLNHVAAWATQRLHTLQACTGQPVHPLDVSDDRLATVLEAVRDDTRWSALEEALNQHTLRVYDLQPAGVRLDSTTANGHWRVTEDGLFQFGHSKDHRPDLPQVQIMVSALEPLGMPVATDVVPGQRAQAAERGLRARLANAQVAVTALNERRRGQRRCPAPPALREAVDAILARDRVQGLWHVRYTDRFWERPRRRSGDRDATVRLEWEGQVTVGVDQEAVAAAVRQLGWRVYVTTQPPEQLSLQEAVWAYRNEYLVERAMGRLKGRPLSLTPLYLERDDHATGMIRLLAIGLRVLTLLECGVRRRLAMIKTRLEGLSVGNPKRATAHPTAERLLEAFQGLTLTILREGRRRRRHLTPLARVQQRILGLLDFPVDLYTRLCPDSHQPP